jgi:hypothetical protein
MTLKLLLAVTASLIIGFSAEAHLSHGVAAHVPYLNEKLSMQSTCLNVEGEKVPSASEKNGLAALCATQLCGPPLNADIGGKL